MATPPAQPTSTKPSSFSEDPQRKLLQQLAMLSVEATRDEARIEQEYAEAMQAYQEQFQHARADNQRKRERNLAAITAKHQENIARIEDSERQDTTSLETATAKVRRQADEEKTSTAESVRKQVDQAKWLAESVLEAVQTQLEIEGRQAKQLQATRGAEVAQQRNAHASLLLRIEQQPVSFEPLSGEEINNRLQEEPDSVYQEQQERLNGLLNSLAALSLPRLLAGATPYLASIGICAVVALLVQFGFESTGSKVVAALVAAIVTGIICAIAVLQLNRTARNQVIAASTPISQAIDLSERAANVSFEQGERQRGEKEHSDRVRCAKEVETAREKGKPILSAANEKLKSALADLATRHEQTQKAIASKKQKRLEDATEMHRAAGRSSRACVRP